jgi:hypothetical protein
MKQTKLQSLAERLFTVKHDPASIEAIQDLERKIALPEQYKELLLFSNGGCFNTDVLINSDPYFMTDTFQNFRSIDEILPEREFTIDLINNENLPLSTDEYTQMLDIGTGGLVVSVILIGISPSNWGQIFWQCINYDWEYYQYKKISNSLYEFLEFIGKDILLK